MGEMINSTFLAHRLTKCLNKRTISCQLRSIYSAVRHFAIAAERPSAEARSQRQLRLRQGSSQIDFGRNRRSFFELWAFVSEVFVQLPRDILEYRNFKVVECLDLSLDASIGWACRHRNRSMAK